MDVYCLDSCSASKGRKVQSVRLRCLSSWARAGGVMIVGYECFRQVAQSNSAHLSAKANADAQQLLLNTADLVVADEAHRVRNSKSALARAVGMLRTRRRIALTGTPIQNNTLELFSMCEFVAPGFLGSEGEFRLRFDGPIRRGQCTDSSPSDVRQMQRRVHVLHKKLQPIVHRVDYEMLRAGQVSGIKQMADNSDELIASAPDPHSIHDVSYLPTKHEYVLFARLSPLQRALYQRFIATHRMSLLKAYHSLQRINNHPSCLESTAAVLDADFDVDGDSDEDGGHRGKKKRNGNDASAAAAAAAAAAVGAQSAWYGDLLSASSGYVSGRIEDSGKLLLCVFLLAAAFRAHERVLIFSQSLDMIDLLENVLERYFQLRRNTGFFRLDGASTCWVQRTPIPRRCWH